MDSSAPTTLTSLLASSSVPLAHLLSQYPSHIFLMNRILGMIPSSLSFVAIHPPLLASLHTLVPNLMNIPWSDVGSSWGWGISPQLRSLVMYVSSRTFGCMYCSAHHAVVGDIFQGPGAALKKNVDAWGACRQPGNFSEAERAAMEYASALASVPSTITEKHCRDLSAHYSPKEIDSITLAVTLGGFLNRCMDTLGSTLEIEPLAYGETYLSKSDWTVGKHRDPAQAQQLEEMKEKIRSPPARAGVLQRVLGTAQLVGHALRAHWADYLLRRAIPATTPAFCAFVKARLGFCPAYLGRVAPSNARQAIAYAVLNVLDVPSPETHLTKQLKYLMALTLVVRAENKLLQGHFAFLAVRNGASVNGVRMIVEGEGARCQVDNHGKLALEFARSNSESGSAMDEEMMRKIVNMFTAQEVVEMTAVVAVTTMLIRLENGQAAGDMEEEVKAWMASAEGRKSGISLA